MGFSCCPFTLSIKDLYSYFNARIEVMSLYPFTLSIKDLYSYFNARIEVMSL